MSYVPPHLRIKKNGLSKSNQTKPISKQNKFEQDFPSLSNTTIQHKQPLNFSNLFIEEENIIPKEKKEEMKKGFVKLTNNGIVDSITDEEYKQIDDNKTTKIINENMKTLYNHIEKTKQYQMAWDINYEPSIVIDEYSSSNYSSSEESEEYAEDPEDDFNEL